MTHTGVARQAARVILGVFLTGAGISHLTWNRTAFRAQVPPWFPGSADPVVIISGIVEIALGAALLALPGRRKHVGIVTALFFVVIFPGNVSQFVTHTDSFGLNSDLSRGLRLLFQPLLVLWALWCTGTFPHSTPAPNSQ